MSTQLTGQRVFVIGGGRAIGRAVAAAAAAAGATPIIGARDGGAHAADQIPGAEAVRIDITDEASIVSALGQAGDIDHIVITTSAHHNASVADLGHDRTVTAIEAKLVGPLMVAKHAAKQLRPGGSIILFSGVAAWNPAAGYSIMGIANGAVSFAASHLAKELAPVRVNAISPGIIDSGTWDGMEAEAKAAFLANAGEGTLVGRVGTNDDIAAAVLWLLGAGFVTGETIHVDGGARFA